MNCIYLKLLHRSNDVFWRFGLNFVFGACYSQFYDRMPAITLRSAALCILAICIAARFTNLFNIAYTLFGGYCLIGIGMTKTFRGTSFQNRFDLSYGIYLYACPLQQLLVFLFSIGNPYVLFIAAMPPVSLMAYLSWSLIESPAMQLRQKLLCYIK